MSQFSGSSQAAIDYNSTIIGALELSEKKWVLAVQLPGVGRHSRAGFFSSLSFDGGFGIPGGENV